jgi:hypothetical protein
MSALYGGVFDYGIGLAINPADAKNILQSGKNAVILPFENEESAFSTLRYAYTMRGFKKYRYLLPQFKYEDYLKYKYYNNSPCTNVGRPRFYAVFNDDFYAIIDKAEIAAGSLFSPNTAYFLKEFETKDDAFNVIFLYYAVKGGVQYAYCNGAPLPVISNVMKLNVFYPSPLPNYFKEHLRLPEHLQRLGPNYYGNQNFFNWILL